ncbi:DUF1257 domain-containing protein [Phormidium sp. FACHB-592]|uniref:DUF1257 domain-containing protein n=1 Tax=Stenomitos frigidus AS-A4 TaxID=2933935 RepID=A0ABV0KSN9_9CYAN|nr:DUF1257 domain-containing protein [Phormidium sp. FACHB-592]MBD2077221.1 DUF1257 domain-containing protein [Phormidium sp. FACHB-592]
MSHFNTFRSKLTDIAILQDSLRQLGFVVQTNAMVRGSNCQHVRADIVAVLEGGYDMGWSHNEDGSLDLITDLWGVARKHDMSQLLNAINQKYAVYQTLAAVQRPGLQNATVKLVTQW